MRRPQRAGLQIEALDPALKGVYDMATTKETIKAATVARYSDKSGKLLGFGVKSNHSDETYCVRFARVDGIVKPTCTCKAGQMNFTGCKSGKCAHVEAVIEVAKARASIEKEKELAEEQKAAVEVAEQHLAAELVASVQATAEQAAHVEDDLRGKKFPTQDELAKLPLSGNAGFSLMRVDPAQAVVDRVRNAPTPRRQQEDW
jgi:hypothetical protein